MPLYEYECSLCRHRFERIQPVAAPPVMECPGCGGSVRRLIGAPALQFKGSGWYVTDYGSGRSRGTTETGKESASSSGAGDSKESPASTTAKSSGEAAGTD